MGKKLNNPKKPKKPKQSNNYHISPMNLEIVNRLMVDALKQRDQIQKNVESVFRINQPHIIAMVKAANEAAQVVSRMNEMLQVSIPVFQRMLEAQRNLHERVNAMVRVMDLPRVLQDMERINSVVNAKRVTVVDSISKPDIVYTPKPVVNEVELAARIEERLWARINASVKTAQISGSRKALSGKIATVDLFLTPFGKLYKIPNYKVCYNFVAQNRNAHKERKDNKRLLLIKYLALGKGDFTHTSTLQLHTESSSEQATRKSISTMNKKIGAKLGLKQPLFDHSQGSGYRINPVYKVIVVDKEVDL